MQINIQSDFMHIVYFINFINIHIYWNETTSNIGMFNL